MAPVSIIMTISHHAQREKSKSGSKRQSDPSVSEFCIDFNHEYNLFRTFHTLGQSNATWSGFYASTWQSASISTSQSSLMKRLTSTKVQAGLITANTSPCALADSFQFSISLRKMRVLTISSNFPSTSSIAFLMILRQCLVCSYKSST